MAHFLEHIDTKRTAILLIEYQNDFTTEGGKLFEAVKPVMDATNMLQNTISLVENARLKGIKIFHAPITFSDDYRELAAESYGILGNVKAGSCFLASQWGGAFHEKITPAAADTVIAGKRGLCAFASTNLDFCLRQNGIETLVIGGFLTNCCVESTMRQAYELGYKVVTLTDCCAATSIEAQDAALKFTFPMFSVPMTSAEFLAKV